MPIEISGVGVGTRMFQTMMSVMSSSVLSKLTRCQKPKRTAGEFSTLFIYIFAFNLKASNAKRLPKARHKRFSSSVNA